MEAKHAHFLPLGVIHLQRLHEQYIFNKII